MGENGAGGDAVDDKEGNEGSPVEQTAESFLEGGWRSFVGEGFLWVEG